MFKIVYGFGYYIINDYKDIFRYVNDCYICVILEILLLIYIYVVKRVMEVWYRKYMNYGNKFVVY